IRFIQIAKDFLAHAREINFHLAARREIFGILARRIDWIEDAVVALVQWVFMEELLQNPVALENSYVRQMPDDWTEAEARAFAQIKLARQIEEPQSLRARACHQTLNLFCPNVCHL